MNEPDSETLKAQLAAHRRTLAALLEQTAHSSTGQLVADIAHTIDTTRVEVERLKVTLRKRGVVVADETNDTAPRAADGIVMGDQRNIATEGGDYAERDVDKRQGVLVSHGDLVLGDKILGDKVLGDKIIQHYHPLPPPPLPPLDEALALLGALPTGDDAPIPDPQPLPIPHRMHLTPNPQFVGREADLRLLVARLKQGQLMAIATGIGGIGKTLPIYYPYYTIVTV